LKFNNHEHILLYVKGFVNQDKVLLTKIYLPDNIMSYDISRHIIIAIKE
jgi:hypothetical protein